MNSLPSDAWLHIISCLCDNSNYYPLELTILKSVSKDFNHLVSHFKNDFEMDKLKMISHYYEYIISNKYYGLLNELKGYPVLFDDGLNILLSVSNNLDCIIYFIENPLITYEPKSNTTIILDFHVAIIDFVLHETKDEYIKNFLTIKKDNLWDYDYELQERLTRLIENFSHKKVMNWFKNSGYVFNLNLFNQNQEL
jgi:hypothetical protein